MFLQTERGAECKRKELPYFEAMERAPLIMDFINSWEYSNQYWLRVVITLTLTTQPCTGQCCGSGMFIPNPDFYPSRIPDQKLQQKRGVKKNLLPYLFFVVTNFTKLNIILFLKCWRKKICTNFHRIIEVFTQKFSLSSQKYGFGIRDPGSRIRIRNTDTVRYRYHRTCTYCLHIS